MLTITHAIPPGYDYKKWCLWDGVTLLCHYVKLSDAAQEKRRIEASVETVYTGRAGKKPSILAACKAMNDVEIPKPAPGQMYETLYPRREY